MATSGVRNNSEIFNDYVSFSSMFGVTINAAAIVVGSILGILLKKWISPAIEKTLQQTLGFCTIIVGIKMALKFENILFLILCMVVGAILGVFLRVDERVEHLGEILKQKFSPSGSGDHSFALGFSICSILYCTGAMGIVGSIESSLQSNHDTLVTKAMIDGIFSAPLAALYGAGVAFSGLSVFLYQGAIVLLAKYVPAWQGASVMNNISGVGGVIVTMIGIKVAGIIPIKLGVYVPAILLALLIAPFLV